MLCGSEDGGGILNSIQIWSGYQTFTTTLENATNCQQINLTSTDCFSKTINSYSKDGYMYTISVNSKDRGLVLGYPGEFSWKDAPSAISKTFDIGEKCINGVYGS
jgi:hypothetical protein